jgi:hypothetical protein
VVECDGLEIREVVLPSDTNQQFTLHSTTSFWGILGGFGSKMCNRMCNSFDDRFSTASLDGLPEGL